MLSSKKSFSDNKGVQGTVYWGPGVLCTGGPGCCVLGSWGAVHWGPGVLCTGGPGCCALGARGTVHWGPGVLCTGVPGCCVLGTDQKEVFGVFVYFFAFEESTFRDSIAVVRGGRMK